MLCHRYRYDYIALRRNSPPCPVETNVSRRTNARTFEMIGMRDKNGRQSRCSEPRPARDTVLGGESGYRTTCPGVSRLLCPSRTTTPARRHSSAGRYGAGPWVPRSLIDHHRCSGRTARLHERRAKTKGHQSCYEISPKVAATRARACVFELETRTRSGRVRNIDESRLPAAGFRGHKFDDAPRLSTLRGPTPLPRSRQRPKTIRQRALYVIRTV